MRCQGLRNTARAASFAATTLMLTTSALADEARAVAVTPRQMAHCLIQRIHEDRRGERTESYQDALRACKQDLAAEANRSTTAMNSGNDTEASK
jgi:hypothetical protein